MFSLGQNFSLLPKSWFEAEHYTAFVVGSPKGDLGHLGDLLPKRGLLKVTFLFKSLLSERKDYVDVLYTSFAAHEA